MTKAIPRRVGPGWPGRVLELRGVSRQFGAVRALTDVSFDCRAGEVHAVVGENGREVDPPGDRNGLSTPIWAPSRSGGTPPPGFPAQARALGLAMAYQDTSLILPNP